MDKTIKRGDIYYADLNPVVGSEQGGTRPVLVISNDIGNKHSPIRKSSPTPLQPKMEPACGLPAGNVRRDCEAAGTGMCRGAPEPTAVTPAPNGSITKN